MPYRISSVLFAYNVHAPCAKLIVVGTSLQTRLLLMYTISADLENASGARCRQNYHWDKGALMQSTSRRKVEVLQDKNSTSTMPLMHGFGPLIEVSNDLDAGSQRQALLLPRFEILQVVQLGDGPNLLTLGGPGPYHGTSMASR